MATNLAVTSIQLLNGVFLWFLCGFALQARLYFFGAGCFGIAVLTVIAFRLNKSGRGTTAIRVSIGTLPGIYVASVILFAIAAAPFALLPALLVFGTTLTWIVRRARRRLSHAGVDLTATPVFLESRFNLFEWSALLCSSILSGSMCLSIYRQLYA